MKQYTMIKSNNWRWAGWNIIWCELPTECKGYVEYHNTDTFFWDVAAGQREVDRLNQAELSMAQGKETV